MIWTNIFLLFNLMVLVLIALMVYAIGEKISEYDNKEKK
jgi:hypothetical protein